MSKEQNNLKTIIAIDPGKNGGIAVFDVQRRKVVSLVKMPETPTDILNFLTSYTENSVCYLEKVGGLPGMGGSAMFNFGKGYGHIEMALLANRIKTITVTPQQWQKILQLGTKGNKSTTEWKNKLRAKAQQLYPQIDKITLATSDALLILEYARIVERQK